jgi:hypothetical protein
VAIDFIALVTQTQIDFIEIYIIGNSPLGLIVNFTVTAEYYSKAAFAFVAWDIFFENNETVCSCYLVGFGCFLNDFYLSLLSLLFFIINFFIIFIF